MVEVVQEVRWVPEFCPECHCRSFADVAGGGGTVRCMNCKSVYALPGSTADDKELVFLAAFNAGLEAAAKVAEQTKSYDDTLHKSGGFSTTGERISTAIRNLKIGEE